MGAMCGGKSDRKPKNLANTASVGGGGGVVGAGTVKTGAAHVEKESFIVSDPPTPRKKNVGQNYNFENITSTKMKFGYGDVKGFWDSYTMLFRYLKLGFEDRYIQNENFWRDEIAPKNGFKLPALPYVVDGEVKITGDDSVMTYLCYKANHSEMVGRTDLDIVKVRMLLGLLRDMKNDVIEILLQVENETEKEKINKKRVEPRMKKLNDYVQHSRGKNCLLGYPTIADFKLYEMLNALNHYNVKGHSNYEFLNNFVEFFEKLFEEQLSKVDDLRINSRHSSPSKQTEIQKNQPNIGDRAGSKIDYE